MNYIWKISDNMLMTGIVMVISMRFLGDLRLSMEPIKI